MHGSGRLLALGGRIGLALIAVIITTLVAACGGGGGGTTPASPAVIDSGNAQVMTREVLDAGLGAGSFGVAVGGGGILSADGGSNALAQGIVHRRTVQAVPVGPASPTGQVQPTASFGPERVDCLVSGFISLSGSVDSASTLLAGDRITADFNACDDADGAVYDGRMRLDVTNFSGDLLANQFALGALVTLTGLAIAEGGSTTTGDGAFDLDLDLTVPLVSALTVSGDVLETRSGSDAWVLRDFAISVDEDSTGVSVLTTYAGTGTLEGSGFDGAVDFATVVPLVATGANDPATGELLITGANGATIRAMVLDSTSLTLAIDLNGDGVVDETQDMSWSTVAGGLGATLHRFVPPLPLPSAVP